MNDIFKLPVHPAAEVFPMLDEDEMQNLVEDIKTNGLLQPLVVKDGMLVDGRNRREACRRAGLQPEVVELNGIDPATYIVATNIERRHLTKSQRAMAVAMIWPENGGKGGRGKKSAAGNPEVTSGFSQRLVQQARMVLRWADDLVDGVRLGAKGIDAAYEEACNRRDKADLPIKRLNALMAKRPDLADRVTNNHLSIDEAEAITRDDEEKERTQRQGIYDGIERLENFAFIFCDSSHRNYMVDICRQFPKELSEDRVRELATKLLIGIQETLNKLEGGD